MREKDLKIDSFVVTCMNNIYGDDAEVNNEWYLECLKQRIQKNLKSYI